jgi:hypothetical protein
LALLPLSLQQQLLLQLLLLDLRYRCAESVARAAAAYTKIEDKPQGSASDGGGRDGGCRPLWQRPVC